MLSFNFWMKVVILLNSTFVILQNGNVFHYLWEWARQFVTFLSPLQPLFPDPSFSALLLPLFSPAVHSTYLAPALPISPVEFFIMHSFGIVSTAQPGWEKGENTLRASQSPPKKI